MPTDITKLPIYPEQDQYDPAQTDQELISEVNRKFDQWRSDRRPHEVQWFINAAFVRGQHYVVWNDAQQQLELKDAPTYRSKLVVNVILPKFVARLSKFLADRPHPVVAPASSDREDKLNARMSQKTHDYQERRLDIKTRYRDALLWAQTCGKGFWWLHWNPDATATVTFNDEFNRPQTQVVQPGDIELENGTPFDLLVADMGESRIANQPEIMRCKLRDVEDVKNRHQDKAQFIKAETNRHEMFQYQRQIATLNAKGVTGLQSWEVGGKGEQNDPTHVLVKELFTKPCAKYPKGRYIKVAGDVLLKHEDELPFNFYDLKNPYPVIEFVDLPNIGQFWPTTVVEQLIGVQKEYNHLRSKIAEQIRLMANPKVLWPQQAQLPDGGFTSEAGEILEWFYIPGMPEPRYLLPPNIAQDVWNSVQLIRQEVDEITGIYPASQGNNQGQKSGFQTNLLQEAADSIHKPIIEGFADAIEETFIKIRRMMKIGWDIPRLVSVSGRSSAPEAFEFSSANIDERCDIIVYTESGLSNSPAVRTQQVLELYNLGMFGDINNPDVKRRALGALRLDGLGELEEMSRRDEDLARLENQAFFRGEEVEWPKPWENHDIAWAVHTDTLKSPEIWGWPHENRMALIEHTLMHAKFINPQSALLMAQELGATNIIPVIQQAMMAGQAFAPAQQQQQQQQPPPQAQQPVEQG